MIKKYSRCFNVDVITHSCHNFNRGLTNWPMKLVHGWVNNLHHTVLHGCNYSSMSQSRCWFNWSLLVNGDPGRSANSVHDFWDVVYMHNRYVIMSTLAQITGVWIVCPTVCSSRSKKTLNDQCSASLAFVRGIHRWPVDSPHKEPVTRKMFPFDDVIMMNVKYRSEICCVTGKHWRNVLPWSPRAVKLT